MSAIVIQPHSLSNPTDKFRVTFYQDWLNYFNGATTSYAFTTCDTYEEAKTIREKLNAEPK
jgi:hypothetical protein